jgi:transcriptional regulator with XRE-family HTH domain
MLIDEKKAFADRLNSALDLALQDVPPKGGGRQNFVGLVFGVSQKGARKWLEGEGFPKLEQVLNIAKRLNVSVEWLLTGRGEMRTTNPGAEAANRAESVINLWLTMPADIQQAWLTYGKFLLEGTKKRPRRDKETYTPQ